MSKNKNKDFLLFTIFTYYICFYSVRCTLTLPDTADLHAFLKEPTKFEL